MKHLLRALLAALVLITGLPGHAQPPVTLGVFALRPEPLVQAMWQPFADYLGAGLGHEVRLRVLDAAAMQAAIARNELDLVLTNPTHLVELRTLSPLSGAIATQLDLQAGRAVSQFGGVILVRRDTPGLYDITDLRGKRVATTHANFLGTFPAQALELKHAGVDPESLQLKHIGQDQDSVVDALLSGAVDAAFVRTGLLEQLGHEGRDLSMLSVLNRQTTPDYPYQRSTRLYPEWPLVALAHADEGIVRKVAALVLALPEDHPAARAARIAGFTIPADYSVVEQLMRELRLPPFDQVAPVTWRDVWAQYHEWIFALALALSAIVLLLARLVQRNLQLARAGAVERRLAEQINLERHHLRNVVEATQAGSWEWNLATDEWIFDRRWAAMLGFDDAPARGQERSAWRALVHPDDLNAVDAEMARLVAGASPCFEHDLRLRHRDGHWVWVHDRAIVVRQAPDGSALLLKGAQIDISRRKLTEEKLCLAASVFSSSYEAILITDANNRIVDVNPAFTRITGYSREESIGRDPSLLSSGRQGAAFYSAMWETLEQNDYWQGELWNRRKDGNEFAEVLSISRVRDGEGKLLHHVATFSDISRLKRQEEELNRIAYFDPLTGAPNRRLLDDRLRQAIAHARRTGKPLAVCVIDLDGFKPVNDRYGHKAGDDMLIGIVDRLNAILRASDTVARLGGDEFVLLLEDADGNAVLERVLEAIGEPLRIGNALISVSASIGVTRFPEDNADPETLLRHADQAMYRAKQRGRNCIQYFDTSVEEEQRLRKLRRQRLEDALRKREFVLHFQPQVNMRTGRVIGIEALIRWQHPEQGLLPPARFLPDIAGTEFETTLDEWVIDAALAQLVECRAQGMDIGVSVNIGARMLLTPGFVSGIRSALARHPGIPADKLELEILESSALDDIVLATEVLHACRRLGVRIALDDFGTGYASLRHYRQLPVDQLKIDRSFVVDMLKDKEARAIVDAVVHLARTFERKVIAEGVETPAHAAALIELGCELGQGFGIARPMPGPHLIPWFSWQSLPDEDTAMPPADVTSCNA
ncbi:EAL domain-containing protein [Thauera sp.]|uniref:EAL domain-containing protein n=1 Tax=Thauera sp. TaxID=1905334 RepID=UPI002A35BB24|nr:EAL domain-containing protein [Thauera sp.]MDX9884774.1 EAL domain-containing protein [Thauera sp.]